MTETAAPGIEETPRTDAGAPLPIEAYALIGDGETAALVGRNGSIDWLCWPRFDSDACLSALLGDASNGAWRLAPTAEPSSVRRRYLPDTLVLETTFETADGEVAIIDFMPPRAGASRIVRLVEGRRGAVEMAMHLMLRFGYGQFRPWTTRPDPRSWCAVAGPDLAHLQAPVALTGEDAAEARFGIAAGERCAFVLTYRASHLPQPPDCDVEAALADTERFWRDWLAQGDGPQGRYAAPMRRALITLKSLICAPTGGLIAAPTTSLPERLGGVRNWDYRYCWLRDATLALLTLISTGHREEASAWGRWLQRALGGSPADLQIMYGPAGERRLVEWELTALPGYEGAKPVRIGNAAYSQFQLDVFGELVDALHHARRAGLLDATSWPAERAIVDHVTAVWRYPDAGIWEVRAPPRHYTFSKIMAWVALDRGIKAIEDLGLDGPREGWRKVRDEIRADVLAHGLDASGRRFKRAYDDPGPDASLLLVGDLGFVAHDDPLFVETVAAIEQSLMTPAGLLLRYDTHHADDGLPPGEAAFLPCSFWLANAYAMLGRVSEAERLFEQLLSLRNDVGLLAEGYDADRGRFAGNFPQVFSHVGLLATALALTRTSSPSHQRAAGGDRV